MNKFDLIVIGGGPAGLMAAGQAARAGGRVLLLEKSARPGQKLSIDDGGRRHLTNSRPWREYPEAYGESSKFLATALEQFSSTELLAHFEEAGVQLAHDAGGRYYPTELTSAEVAEVLADWSRSCGAEIRTESPVDELWLEDGRIEGVICGKQKLQATRILIATGGLSYPNTGASGDGYRLAESAGHVIVPLRAAQVPLATDSELTAQLSGTKLDNVGLSLIVGKTVQKRIIGSLTFESYGFSGPAVLHVSLAAVDALEAGDRVGLSLNLLPYYDERKIEAWLVTACTNKSDQALTDILQALLPSQLTPTILASLDLPAELLGGELTAAERRVLRKALGDFQFEIAGARPIDEALVTAGGVSLDEVDPNSMESRYLPGLYFAGEVLDLDGPTDGFNLQVAFSTGWLVGQTVAQQVQAARTP